MEDMNVSSMVEEGNAKQARGMNVMTSKEGSISGPITLPIIDKDGIWVPEPGEDVIDFIIRESEKYKELDLKPEDLYPTQFETTVFVHISVRITKSGRRKARYEGHVFGGRTTAELLMKWGQYRAIQNFLRIQRIIRVGESAKRVKEMSTDGIS